MPLTDLSLAWVWHVRFVGQPSKCLQNYKQLKTSSFNAPLSGILTGRTADNTIHIQRNRGSPCMSPIRHKEAAYQRTIKPLPGYRGPRRKAWFRSQVASYPQGSARRINHTSKHSLLLAMQWWVLRLLPPVGCWKTLAYASVCECAHAEITTRLENLQTEGISSGTQLNRCTLVTAVLAWWRKQRCGVFAGVSGKGKIDRHKRRDCTGSWCCDGYVTRGVNAWSWAFSWSCD